MKSLGWRRGYVNNRKKSMKSSEIGPEYNSVCMAAYNGERYIKKQMDSILSQIASDDELIIIDDGSSDNTTEIIKQISDPRIKLVLNEKNLGVIRTFDKAISMASGRYIFLTDQDDIWTEGRYKLMLDTLKRQNVLLVTGNLDTIDSNDNKSDVCIGKVHAKDSSSYGKNLFRIFTGRAYYYGCAMAFDRKLKNAILPFPEGIESHDLWIAMAANYLKSNAHLDDIVLLHRIHGKNVTDMNRPLKAKLKTRVIMFSMLKTLKERRVRGV